MKMKMKMKMITAAILSLLAIVGMLPPSCMANQYRNSLKTGESLEASEFLSSGDYLFMMQPNCNLVLYHDSTAVWSTGTGGRDYSCSANFLGGGNLVVYSPKGVSLWESSTGTTGILGKDSKRTNPSSPEEYVLVLRKDGNVVMYGMNWKVVWPTGNTVTDQWLVSPEPTNILYPGERLKANESLILGTFKCTMQTNCNFACKNDTQLHWHTNTTGKGSGCYLEVDSQGNLAIYNRVRGITGGWSGGSYVLIIQKSSILGIYGPVFWSTNWDGLTTNSTAQFSNHKIVTVISQ